jgi:enoyl-CoA hydratase/3-hydroxyacyl-CoA dehydrogenase
MSSLEESARRLGVVGAGNMGSGIAQKMVMEGFEVILVDLDEAKVSRGVGLIDQSLREGVARGLFREADVVRLMRRIRGTTDFGALADTELVVEAVFEDVDVKREVFARLDRACPLQTILATNTSSFAVTELASATRHPERVVGLHYFYHPAKNRLVEVVAGAATDPRVIARAWALQELLGKTPIRSRDSFGFIVNRFFAAWLVEAIRLLEERIANVPTIEAAAIKAFGIGMGPFELMNVTGLPIALHTATTLGTAFGPMYAPPPLLASQVKAGVQWSLDGDLDRARIQAVADRLAAVTFLVAAALVDEGVGTMEDTDIGARVGLRWRRGPFEMMNDHTVARAASLATPLADRWRLPLPGLLARQAKSGEPFRLALVRSETVDGIATVTINRPDVMNALNEAVVEQLSSAFQAAAGDPGVRAIVIAGSGKAFVAGADIRFFIENIEAKRLERTEAFTRRGQVLLRAIETCPKPVVARVHGLALGGGVEVALACHAIVATPKASFAFPETGIGIYPGLGGTQRTTRRVGTGLAKWLVLTGQVLDAETALQIGLIDRVVPREALDSTIAELVARGPIRSRDRRPLPAAFESTAAFFDRHDVDALIGGRVETGGDERLAKAVRRIGSKAPVALRLAGDLIVRGADVPIEQALDMELEHLHTIFSTRDAYEGLTSLGKRAPVFEGR